MRTLPHSLRFKFGNDRFTRTNRKIVKCKPIDMQIEIANFVRDTESRKNGKKYLKKMFKKSRQKKFFFFYQR